MAWEKRGGRSYYYRSRRAGERVRKEYIGAGEFAEALAHSDETIRRVRKLERDRNREEVERLQALAAPLEELNEATNVLVRAYLVARGFHQRKGQWRRERGT
jgi:hypothetical protein